MVLCDRCMMDEHEQCEKTVDVTGDACSCGVCRNVDEDSIYN